MKVVFDVKGMHCKKCANKIETFVGDVSGVGAVEVDFNSGEVVVSSENGARFDVDEVADSIMDAGFDVEMKPHS